MKRNFPQFLLYAFGFLLLLEWLRPIEQLTETNHIETFIAFLLVSFLASFFNIKRIWQFIIKLLFIFVSINRFHYHEGFFHFRWLKSFFIDFKNNMGLIFARNWNDLSNNFRTLLFFIFLWLMVYLIQYWLLKRQRIFIFFFMTLVYITVLDTFTPYSAKVAIVRTVVCGFATMGMLTFYRITKRENMDKKPTFIRKWMTPLAGMIAISVLVGIAAPKAAPIWPDPVPYLTTASNKAGMDGNGGTKRIGYGTNDASLGGPFIGDNNPVFRVESNGKNYWKVETKDMYTGKGWIPSGSTPISFREEDLVPVYSIPSTVETSQETAKVMVYPNFNYNHLMYPAGIQKYHAIQPVDQLLEIDTTKERIVYLDNKRNPVIPNSYWVDFEIPKYKATDLQKVTQMDESMGAAKFLGKYTQLPDELPPRIKQLAEDITANETNWFDKAKAVESYFGSTDYTYDQKNVAVPGEGVDYVDQFLFETKLGYCDNFSSSMAVMLRTIGIPTRWVKGYTGGDFLEYSDQESTKQFYQITNNNAHSWVEVFFPNQGWVPFEPTKGFTNEVNISYVSDAQTPLTNQTPPAVEKPQKEQMKETGTKEAKKSFDLKSIWSNTKMFLKNNWKKAVLILATFACVMGILYRIRGKWIPYGVLLQYRFKKKDDSFGTAYVTLLHQLNRYGLKRKENQTLSNYARYIDSFFSTREMTRLTAIYEQYMYHQLLPKGTWEETHQLWENLIKKTIA